MDCAVLAGSATAVAAETDTGEIEVGNEMVSRPLTRCDGFLECGGEEAPQAAEE